MGGQVAQRVLFGLPRLEAAAAELSGRRVEGVESRGKALLVHFEGERSVYTHGNLYGRWRFQKAGSAPPRTQRQLRFAVHTAAGSALLYSASDIEVLDRDAIDRHPFLAGLGPDALDAAVDAAAVEARLLDPRFCRRALGGLLLDQGFVAGLGNYLRSEILFFSRLLPGAKPASLSPSQLGALAESILDVTRRSYRTGGITVEDELARALKAEGEKRRTMRHHVFSRAGRPCRRCDSPIERAEAAGRRIYFCPGCQG